MAVESYKAWFEIADPDEDHTGTRVGTAVSVSAAPALSWYLAKAGIQVQAPPTTGQGWPR